MSDGATFNIGSQQAGTIFVAGRDQAVGKSHGALSVGAPGAVSDLRVALAATRLEPLERRRAEDLLNEIEREVLSDQPDRAGVASRLQSLVVVLRATGALTRQGEELIVPLRHLAGWLGHAGATLLRLLG
jgi:hypothetical protein